MCCSVMYEKCARCVDLHLKTQPRWCTLHDAGSAITCEIRQYTAIVKGHYTSPAPEHIIFGEFRLGKRLRQRTSVVARDRRLAPKEPTAVRRRFESTFSSAIRNRSDVSTIQLSVWNIEIMQLHQKAEESDKHVQENSSQMSWSEQKRRQTEFEFKFGTKNRMRSDGL